jgi:hypothetical protein
MLSKLKQGAGDVAQCSSVCLACTRQGLGLDSPVPKKKKKSPKLKKLVLLMTKTEDNLKSWYISNNQMSVLSLTFIDRMDKYRLRNILDSKVSN